MPSRAFNWTDDRIAQAKALWIAGESGDTVAAMLNENLTLADAGPVTRNAVIGKMHRLGFKQTARSSVAPSSRPRPQPPRPYAPPRFARPLPPEPAPAPAGASAARAGLEATIERMIEDPAERDEALAFARTQGCTLLDLRNDSCRWPIGTPGQTGFHFCGGKAPGLDAREPYCGYHSRIAYAAPVARRDQRPRPR